MNLKQMVSIAVLALTLGMVNQAFAGGIQIGVGVQSYEFVGYAKKGTNIYASVEKSFNFDMPMKLSVLGKIGTGVSDPAWISGTTKAFVKIDYDAIVLGKLAYPINDFSPYIVLGYSSSAGTTKVYKNGVFSEKLTGTESAGVYGVGADYNLSKKIAIGAEYTTTLYSVDKKAMELHISYAF